MKIEVPEAFLTDHLNRACNYGEVTTVAKKSTGITIECSGADVHDLLEDAQHYVELGVRELGTGFLGLVGSAAATVRRIKKAFTAEQLAGFAAEADRIQAERQAAWKASPEGIAVAAEEAARKARKEQEAIDHPILTKLPAGTTVTVDGRTFVLASVRSSYVWGQGITVHFTADDGERIEATFATPDHYDYHLRIGKAIVGDRVAVAR